MNRKACAAALALLALPGTTAIAQRKGEPPLRQPSLLAPIPAPEPAPPRPRSAPGPTTRPAQALADWDRAYDTTSPAFAILQRPHDALAGFALDRAGHVDWGAALESGRIAPRASLDGTVTAALAHTPDVILRNTKAMPWVRFPHGSHARWLDCGNCHPAPFAERAGSAAITMEGIFRGEACGLCHGRVAFVAWQNCERCHSVPRPGDTGLYGNADRAGR